jgi:hypothetical protein
MHPVKFGASVVVIKQNYPVSSSTHIRRASQFGVDLVLVICRGLNRVSSKMNSSGNLSEGTMERRRVMEIVQAVAEAHDKNDIDSKL